MVPEGRVRDLQQAAVQKHGVYGGQEEGETSSKVCSLRNNCQIH